MEAKRNFEGCISHGPWGYTDGDKWFYDKGDEWVYLPKGFIKKITIEHGSNINSIKFQTYCSTFRAGDSTNSFFLGYQEDTICIDYPDEYLVSISGTFGYNCSYGSDVLKSICFKTNENNYGPFGTRTRGDIAFSYDAKDGIIVGFHGCTKTHSAYKHSVRCLTAIGVYVMPNSLVFEQNVSTQTSRSGGKIVHEVCSSMPRMVMPRDAGPWGANGGNPWDDGLFATIKQVRVHVGELNVICALQFEYLTRDGKSVTSQIHGETGETEVELVNLDVKDDEYLIGISGYYGPVEAYDGSEAIVSISFHTSKRIYRPYGKRRGAGCVYYSSTPSPGKVVGFHGRDNGYLSAIGVYMEYF